MHMHSSKIYHVYDSHTAGMPTRVMLEGVPTLKGKTMMEKKKYLQTNFDQIRTVLTQEPRSSQAIAALLVPPCDPGADFGVIFSDFRGYVDMCIHGTIGVVTTLIELGLVSGMKQIAFDTPAGSVRAKARVSGGRVKSVTVSNVPSIHLKDVDLDVPSVGRIRASLAFGGNVYAYVNARELGIAVKPANLRTLLSVASKVLRELREVEVSHPSIPSMNEILGVSLYEDEKSYARNIVVAENDLFDRSPCGTGTCGRMAILNHESKLKPGEKFVNRSIIGSEFIGRITREITIGGKKAVLPEVTGSAYLTGIAELVLSEGDALANGFILSA